MCSDITKRIGYHCINIVLLCRIPIEERGLKYSYNLIEFPISGDRGLYADFSMENNVFYFNQDMEKQCVKFIDAHTFLALYNQSFFVRMHVHNVWLLRHTKIDIILPEHLFETQDYVFLFCGTMQIRGICDDFEINVFDFVNLVFVVSYLMVTDELLAGIIGKL